MVLFSRWTTLLCNVYRPFGLVFYHRLCNLSQSVCYFHVCYCDQSGVACSLQFVTSQLWTECQRTCLIQLQLRLVRLFNTVWYVERIAHAALSLNLLMSAGSTELAMSISEVRIIVLRTWWTRLPMAFACGFLIVVGLRFMLYELHNVQSVIWTSTHYRTSLQVTESKLRGTRWNPLLKAPQGDRRGSTTG